MASSSAPALAATPARSVPMNNETNRCITLSSFVGPDDRVSRRPVLVAIIPVSSVLERHADVLDLRAGQELLDRLLASHAGLLVAAEGHADPVLAGIVDPDVAGFDFGRQTVRAIQIV